MSCDAGDLANDCGLSGVLDNGVTTWMYAKLYSRQLIVSVQLLLIYKPTGAKFSVYKIRSFYFVDCHCNIG